MLGLKQVSPSQVALAQLKLLVSPGSPVILASKAALILFQLEHHGRALSWYKGGTCRPWLMIND